MKTYTILTPDGMRLSPVPESVLRTDLRDGRYPVGTMALAEGMDDWVPLESLFPATPADPEEEVDIDEETRNPWRALVYNIRHFHFEGRATRREFVMVLIAVVVLSVFIFPLLGALIESTFAHGDDIIAALGLYVSLTLLPIIFLLPVGGRRLHDSGHSAWWLALIPVFYPIGLIYVIYLLCLDSQYGNEYGPSTKYPN